ncbi:TspO/MBR family protein [Ignavigranum ruoffiae]|uniref:TspO/MBR family protein n=1 Tax=Ignavigranum ruoffiae TaxID=89093 RepID=UPI002354BA79|nr:TspO/MBR family protein [Ignavigranum ruoffiae]
MSIKKLFLVAAPLLGGAVVGKLTTPHAKADYQEFKQPTFAPPKETFGIVWPLLYTAMGIARCLIEDEADKEDAIAKYDLQLALNYLWSVLYFKFKLRGAAFIESFVLLASVISTTVKFFEKNKLAGSLLIPYVAWSAFATYLNGATYQLNEDNPKYSRDKIKITPIKRAE